jgi:hypothetical protein
MLSRTTAAVVASPIPWGTIATVIIGVLAVSALLGWMMWRVCRTAGRMEKDARFLRRILVGVAVFYSVGLCSAIVKVVTGEAPAWSLLFAPIPLYVIWVYLKAAKRAKVPPKP